MPQLLIDGEPVAYDTQRADDVPDYFHAAPTADEE